jgi:hypothetical protein
MFDKAQIEKLRKDLKISDPGIFEKTVRALGLLTSVLKRHPGLIFKGGTSILLHKFPPARLSIDIDILLLDKDRASLAGSVQQIAQDCGFKTVEQDERESVIPKAHYKFRYDPFFGNREDSILLDVVFCEHPYHRLVERSLKDNVLVLSDMDIPVKIPTPEGLLGDKMTAAAPKTLGLRLTNHLVGRITPDDLKVSFGKIAYMARLMRDAGAVKIVKDVDLAAIEGVRLEGRYKILEGLKKRSAPAYFFWAMAVGISE